MAFKEYLKPCLEAFAGQVAAVKPNIAFFEQFGIGGLRAFSYLLKLARELDILVIADAKRGDIGSTAAAYGRAFIGGSRAFDKSVSDFEADALTVNPFLGFDTLEPFLNSCREYGKGLFVLVKTSNPGSGELQSSVDASGRSVSQRIALWLDKNADALRGSEDYSGLGAVVGATYPEQAQELRSIMKNNYFLVPGYGAQGGSARDAFSGADHKMGGVLVVASRALFSNLNDIKSVEALKDHLKKRLLEINSDLNKARV